jgi:flagellar basal-body rod modification protein FlgD
MSVSAVSSSDTTSTSTSTSAAAQLSENSDAFLQLLLKQLEVQDPTNPVDTTEYMSQLVSLAQMEQEMENGDKLDSILSQVQSLNYATNGLSYLGKTIEAAGDTTSIQDGKASWEYDLDENADSVKIEVLDEDGKTVYSTTGGTDAGTNSFTWDGTVTSGAARTSGAYTLKVTALDEDGEEIDGDLRIKGKVTSVDNSSGSIVLNIGDVGVSADDVVSIS